MLIVLFGLAVWAVCGALAYGITFAYFEWRFPGLGSHRYIAGCMAFAGPIGLAVAFALSGCAEHGLKFRSTENG